MDENLQKNNFKYWYEKIRTYYFYNIQPKFSQSYLSRRKAWILFAVCFFVAIYVVSLISAPTSFPLGDVITIHSGDSLKGIGDGLYNEKAIKSEFVFRTAVIVLGGERRIIAGDYLLDKKETSIGLAYRLVKGEFHLESIKITIPEGWNIYKIADYLSEKIVKFDKAQFLNIASKEEGYLFPDTYFVSATIKPEEVVKLMKDNFENKVSSVEEIKSYSKSLSDIITMASILEGEALPEDRRVVAGILWRRLAIGMPLQIDSSFMYVNGKNTYELTLDDLKIDSLYNTYKYKGLPPGPISNPGIDAITSAVTPISTKYLYFLTEKDGTIHYAKTFEEHKKNKEIYLR